MTDDKTAEHEAARQSLITLAESIRNGLPTFPDDAQMLYDIADMLAAVRRVAPDRETKREQIEAFIAALTPAVTNETHAWNLWNLLASDRGPLRDALESAWGVLGVPADQRTADHETIAKAIWQSDLDYTPDSDAWSKLPESHRDEYRANADAVLAVLVPAEGGER